MSPKSDHVLSPTVATEHGRWDRFKEHSSSYDELNGRSIKPVAADTHFLTPTAASRYASVRFDRNSEVMPWDLEGTCENFYKNATLLFDCIMSPSVMQHYCSNIEIFKLL